MSEPGPLKVTLFKLKVGMESPTLKPMVCLVVRHLGDFSDKIVSARVSFSCRVWLLPANFIDDEWGQRGVLVSVPPVDNPIQPLRGIGPRIGFGEPQASGGVGASKERLVEGMLRIDKRGSNESGDALRNRFDPLDLPDLFSGLTIELSNVGERAVLHVGAELPLGILKARFCPINALLRGFEEIGHD